MCLSSCTREFTKVYQLDQKKKKGKQEWNKACVNFTLCLRKLNTQVKKGIYKKIIDF
jgi:hypothetical protein